MHLLTNWALAFSAATISLLIATANGKSGLSKRMETVIGRYIPAGSPALMIRYIALLIIGLFAAAYTMLGVKAGDPQSIFASALASTVAIEMFPGTKAKNEGTLGRMDQG